MSQAGRSRVLFIGACLCVVALNCLSPPGASARTQDADDAPFRMLAEKAYEAYVRKDRQALLALCSPNSPHLPRLKQFVEQELSLNEEVKLALKRVSLIRTEARGDRATIRVVANIEGTHAETGLPAEGYGELDHTLELVREGGAWKIWKFADTAEEFLAAYLTARTDAERDALVNAQARTLTVGLEMGLLNQGRLLLEERGDDTHAVAVFNLVLKFAEQLKDVEGAGGALVGMGDVSSAQGDYARAAEFYQRVLKLCEDIGLKVGVAAMLTKMGNVHNNQGDARQALEYYQKSVRLYEEAGTKIEIAYPLANVGDAYFAGRDYEKALENYRKSLAIYEQIFDRAGTAYLLNRVGQVHAARGASDRAEESYRKSLKFYEETGNKAMAAYPLNNLGELYYERGDYREAAALSGRAADLAREGKAPEALWRALTSAGRARRALGQHEPARRAFVEAVAVVERLRGQTVGSEQDRQRFFESKTAPYVALVDLLVARGEPDEAFAYAERAKGRMLLDVLRGGRADIHKSMTPAERDQERSLNAAITALNSQLRREASRPAPDRALVAAVEAELQNARLAHEAFETRIYAAHPDLKIQRGDAEPLSAAGAAALLPDEGTAFLEYVVAQERTYLFVLTRGGKPGAGGAGAVDLKVYTINVKAQELSVRVNDFRRRLARNSLDFKESARQLYELLLRPAQGELDGKTLVCIVPADQLWELPFQALLSKPDRYFLEDHALFYVPSLSILRETRKRADGLRAADAGRRARDEGAALVRVNSPAPPSTPRLLALGNPELSAGLISRTRSDDAGAPVGSLPEAEREVKILGEIYGPRNSTILTGAAAREEAVKAEASKYPVLHFAAHGVLDNDNPLYSRLLLASAGGAEDGFLEAREIMRLELHADLAVLSSCQTARGRVSAGEGLIGMSWALFIAGTSTTVASQWPVDSASTARLMVDFHRSLRAPRNGARVGKAEAFRRAALKLMPEPKYRHPFFWAGFVVVGDGM